MEITSQGATKLQARPREVRHSVKRVSRHVSGRKSAIGTLIGLRNKIVLKENTSTKRMVLVPVGEISFRKRNSHTQVSIDTETVTRSQAYNVDERLGRLIDNGSAHSKLLAAYLHALTSFCLPDPLTGRTRTSRHFRFLTLLL